MADLMKKYKLLDQDEEYDQNESRDELLTGENIDDEDEAVISK